MLLVWDLRFNQLWLQPVDRLCGLVVTIPGYGSRGPGFDSRRYKIFWEVVVLERGPLSLVSTTEELLGRKIIGFALGNRDYGGRDPLRWERDTHYLQKLLTSPTSSGLSFSIVRSRTQATEFFLLWRSRYWGMSHVVSRKGAPITCL
jgi:hypothetical protein